MVQANLDLTSLNVVLQRVRRHPQDRSLRLAAAQDVALLADHAAGDGDKLLQEAKSLAKMLRRALHRANQRAIADSTDLAAVKAWIDKLQVLLFRAIAR
jgi:hypothetical protein